MTEYKYVAVNLQNQKIQGYFAAEDEGDLSVQLAKQGLFLVSAKVYTGKTPSNFFTLGTGKVEIKELTSFCRQFSIMLTAGVPMIESLKLLKRQKYSTFFRSILNIIYEDVKGGMMLAEALEKHKSVFPSFFRSMISVGEKSGKFDEVLNALADYYEGNSVIRREIKSALSYPLMLLGMTVAIVILMLAYIVPTFRESLSGLDVEPTGLTLFVFNLSEYVLANWLYMLAILTVTILVVFIFIKTKPGRYCFDAFKAKGPIIGRVTRSMITSRFARSFGLLLSSGMDVSTSLHAARIVFNNKEIEKRYDNATEDIEHGLSMSEAFSRYKLFPSMLIQMIAVGEKTASVEEILEKTYNFFDDQVRETIQAITSLIQPIMLIMLGGIIGTLFIAVYSPILSVITSI